MKKENTIKHIIIAALERELFSRALFFVMISFFCKSFMVY